MFLSTTRSLAAVILLGVVGSVVASEQSLNRGSQFAASNLSTMSDQCSLAFDDDDPPPDDTLPDPNDDGDGVDEFQPKFHLRIVGLGAGGYDV